VDFLRGREQSGSVTGFQRSHQIVHGMGFDFLGHGAERGGWMRSGQGKGRAVRGIGVRKWKRKNRRPVMACGFVKLGWNPDYLAEPVPGRKR
jgi:hypothetical protein